MCCSTVYIFTLYRVVPCWCPPHGPGAALLAWDGYFWLQSTLAWTHPASEILYNIISKPFHCMFYSETGPCSYTTCKDIHWNHLFFLTSGSGSNCQRECHSPPGSGLESYVLWHQNLRTSQYKSRLIDAYHAMQQLPAPPPCACTISTVGAYFPSNSLHSTDRKYTTQDTV